MFERRVKRQRDLWSVKRTEKHLTDEKSPHSFVCEQEEEVEKVEEQDKEEEVEKEEEVAVKKIKTMKKKTSKNSAKKMESDDGMRCVWMYVALFSGVHILRLKAWKKSL